MDDLLLTNDVVKSDAFNSYFSSVSTVDNPDSIISDDAPHIHSKLENILITHQDVTDVIINLKNDKACDLDLINHTLLNESIHVLSFPLTLRTGKFPNMWEMANLTPILKVNNPI